MEIQKAAPTRLHQVSYPSLGKGRLGRFKQKLSDQPASTAHNEKTVAPSACLFQLGMALGRVGHGACASIRNGRLCPSKSTRGILPGNSATMQASTAPNHRFLSCFGIKHRIAWTRSCCSIAPTESSTTDHCVAQTSPFSCLCIRYPSASS